MTVGSQCTAPCPSGRQGVGYVAQCTIVGWQVTARDCSDVPPPRKPCNFLPTLNAPAGSKGWAAGCAGRKDGESCQASCDGINSYFGSGYTALCWDGQWAVQLGGGCHGKIAMLCPLLAHARMCVCMLFSAAPLNTPLQTPWCSLTDAMSQRCFIAGMAHLADDGCSHDVSSIKWVLH
jgi:hypothetical protein